MLFHPSEEMDSSSGLGWVLILYTLVIPTEEKDHLYWQNRVSTRVLCIWSKLKGSHDILWIELAKIHRVEAIFALLPELVCIVTKESAVLLPELCNISVGDVAHVVAEDLGIIIVNTPELCLVLYVLTVSVIPGHVCILLNLLPERQRSKEEAKCCWRRRVNDLLMDEPTVSSHSKWSCSTVEPKKFAAKGFVGEKIEGFESSPTM